MRKYFDLLDCDEHFYLRAILDPYIRMDSVLNVSVTKLKDPTSPTRGWLKIVLYGRRHKNNWFINLPPFPLHKMYLSLELNRTYVREELGL